MATETDSAAIATAAASEPTLPGQPSRESVIAELGITDEPESQQGEPGSDGAHTPVEAGATPAPATDAKTAEETKPADDKPADPPPENLTDDVKAARRILAAADRTRKEAIEATKRAKAVEEKARGYDTFAADLRKSPIATLTKLGMSVDDLLIAATREAGEAPPADAPKPAEDPRVAELQKRIDEREQREQREAFQAEANRIIDGIKAAPEKYPHINRGGAHDLVIETMVEYFNLHKAPLPREKAAEQVETYLRTLAGTETKPAAPTSAKDPKATDGAAKPSTPSNAQPAQQRAAATTLKNNETREVPPGGEQLPEDFDARRAAVLRELALA